VQHDVGTGSLFVGYLFYFYCDGNVCKMTKWIREHKETISILAVIAGALLAGVLAGFVLIVIANVVGIW
jgi:hypothetical protein